MRDDFFEALLSFLVAPEIEEALGDDVYETIGVKNDALFEESRRVVDNREIELFGLLRAKPTMEVLPGDIGDGFGKSESLADFSTEFAVLIGVRQSLPEVMKQRPSRDQHQVEVFAGPSSDIQGLFRNEDAVADILLAETRLQEYCEISFTDDR